MKRLDGSSRVSSEAADDQVSGQIKSLEAQVAELTEANNRLATLQEEHLESLSHVSHELRTPLTSILGFSEILLSQEDLTDTQRNFVRRIQNSAHQLQKSLEQLSAIYREQRLARDGRLSK